MAKCCCKSVDCFQMTDNHYVEWKQDCHDLGKKLEHLTNLYMAKIFTGDYKDNLKVWEKHFDVLNTVKVLQFWVVIGCCDLQSICQHYVGLLEEELDITPST